MPQSQHLAASISTLPLDISCMNSCFQQANHLLGTLFGYLLSCALNLVDRMGVTLARVEEGGREVVTMRGSTGLRYKALKVCHYCLCLFYQYKVY